MQSTECDTGAVTGGFFFFFLCSCLCLQGESMDFHRQLCGLCSLLVGHRSIDERSQGGPGGQRIISSHLKVLPTRFVDTAGKERFCRERVRDLIHR